MQIFLNSKKKFWRKIIEIGIGSESLPGIRKELFGVLLTEFSWKTGEKLVYRYFG